MKIGIDTFSVDSGRTAVGGYLKQILKRIKPSSYAQYELFGWDFDRFNFTETAPDIDFISRCRVNGRTANALWHIVSYPRFAIGRSYDTCFFPAANRRVPAESPCPSVGTVHDMATFWGSRKTRVHLGAVGRVVFPSSLRHLDRVIAVSDFVKDELIKLAGVKENRIEVIPNGIDKELFYPRPRNNEETVLIQPFSFRRPYILYVSRIDYPVKNHIKLIEAFCIFRDKTKLPHRLVLAGGDSHGADLVKEAAQNCKYGQDIFFTGHFPQESLPELYAGAHFSVMPSLYEGFGQAVLESMACGIPVVCARAASLPETAEHCALYFDPQSAEDMADRMINMVSSKAVYNECREKGLEQVKAFSWDTCAEKTLKLLQETAAK
ncbi:MAG: glycosyltransferase family 4 protein [Spirochaetaceae bacterium]|nr:glycosyltransferase family 4 protein [Spirochaetaceae bacterium]